MPYRSADARARLASGLLAAYIAGNFLFTIGGLAGIFSALNNPAAVVVDTVAVWTFYGASVGSVVVFCMWLHRTVGNMPALGTSDSVWTAGKAVTFCFIPGGFLVQPMWSVLDAWRGADASALHVELRSLRAGRMPGLVAAWWLSWLIGVGCALIGRRAGGQVVSNLGLVSFTAAALFCILVIRSVTNRQERKHEMIATGQLV